MSTYLTYIRKELTMNTYLTYEGFTYSSMSELNDKALNCIEVLRSNQLHSQLNITDNSDIILYEPSMYSNIVGKFCLSWNSECEYLENTIHLSREAIQSLDYGRYLYIHELTHKLLYQNGFKGAGHGGHFLTVLCALLIRAFG